MLNVYESHKEHRRAEAAAVGAKIMLSFDFTKQSGVNVGESWLLTVKNEDKQTVGKKAGPSSNYADYQAFIEEIGARDNVTAELLVFDDLSETEAGEYATKQLQTRPDLSIHAHRLFLLTATCFICI